MASPLRGDTGTVHSNLLDNKVNKLMEKVQHIDNKIDKILETLGGHPNFRPDLRT